MYKKVLFTFLFLYTSLFFSQVEKELVTVPEKPILRQASFDSIQFPILPYQYNTSLSNIENLNHILSNLYASVVVANGKIEQNQLDSGAINFIIDENGKLKMKNGGSRRKEYKDLLEKDFLILIQHFDYLESIGKKIIPTTNLNTNKTSAINYSIPIKLHQESFEDKYNRNTSILRGPLLATTKDIPLQNFASSYIDFSTKVQEFLDLYKVFDTKKEFKLLLKISKEGKIFIEDAQSNNKSIKPFFEKKMQKVYDWLDSEKEKGNSLQPALNIYNEEVDYFLEFSNFSLNKD